MRLYKLYNASTYYVYTLATLKSIDPIYRGSTKLDALERPRNVNYLIVNDLKLTVNFFSFHRKKKGGVVKLTVLFYFVKFGIVDFLSELFYGRFQERKRHHLHSSDLEVYCVMPSFSTGPSMSQFAES